MKNYSFDWQQNCLVGPVIFIVFFVLFSGEVGASNQNICVAERDKWKYSITPVVLPTYVKPLFINLRANGGNEVEITRGGSGVILGGMAQFIQLRAREELQLWLVQRLESELCENEIVGYFPSTCSAGNDDKKKFLLSRDFEAVVRDLRSDVRNLPACALYQRGDAKNLLGYLLQDVYEEFTDGSDLDELINGLVQHESLKAGCKGESKIHCRLNRVLYSYLVFRQIDRNFEGKLSDATFHKLTMTVIESFKDQEGANSEALEELKSLLAKTQKPQLFARFRDFKKQSEELKSIVKSLKNSIDEKKRSETIENLARLSSILSVQFETVQGALLVGTVSDAQQDLKNKLGEWKQQIESAEYRYTQSKAGLEALRGLLQKDVSSLSITEIKDMFTTINALYSLIAKAEKDASKEKINELKMLEDGVRKQLAVILAEETSMLQEFLLLQQIYVAFQARDYATMLAVISENLGEWDANLLKYEEPIYWASSLAGSKDASEFSAKLDKLASPVGSWRLKNEGRMVAVNAFGGVRFGRDEYRVNGLELDTSDNQYNVFAPIGVHVTWPLRKSYLSNWGLFFSVLDLGNLIKPPTNIDTGQGVLSVNSGSSFSDAFAPGLYGTVHVNRDAPFTLGVGASYGPSDYATLTNTTTTPATTVTTFSADRELSYHMFIAIDIVLFPIRF